MIQAPEQFHHGGELPGGLLRDDPRAQRLPNPVFIDLRYCRFVQPSAVLWCLIYSLLVVREGQLCELLVPEDPLVARYLKTLGLYDLLRDAEVQVDDRGIAPAQAKQIALPLRCFRDLSDVDRFSNEALDKLTANNLGAPNMRTMVVEAFAELANNAVEHSESNVGAFGLIQYLPLQAGPRFVCAVADGGIGIRRSLEKNPKHRAAVHYDWDAIELALTERVSGTGIATRGIGLYAISQDMRKPGRDLLVHSGLGIVHRTEELETDSRRGTLFPGTLAYAALQT